MTPNRVFTVEITPTVSSSGDTSTFLFCSEPWATRAADVPANSPVQPYLKSAGTFKQELFSGARVSGDIRPSFGNIVLANPAPIVGDAGPFDAWLGYGLSGAKVVVRWGCIGDAYPSQWVTVFIAYVASALVDMSDVTLRLRDRSYLFDAPLVTDGFDGSGGLEGSGSVPKPKQFVASDAGFIPPILVDAVKQIYFVQATGEGGVRDTWKISPTIDICPFDVFEDGVEISRAGTDYSSSADLLASEPAPGEVRYWWGTDSTWAAGWKNGPVYFRLGTPPVGDLRVYAIGYANDADFARWGAVTGSFSLAALALRAGVDRDSIETSSVSLPMALVDDDRPFADVMSGACLAMQGWFGFTRLDTFRDGYLCDPEDDGIWYGIDWAGAGLASAPTAQPTASKYTFSDDTFKGLRREPVNGMEAPVWKVSVKARKTWASQVNEGASDTMRDYLTRDPWWATFQGVSDTCIVANPGAQAVTVEIPYSDFPNVFSRRLYLERYFVLFGGRRDFLTFTTPLTDDVLALNLHDVVTLQSPRLGLSSGKKYRITSIFIDLSAPVPSVRLGVWGGDIGDYTGTVSMVSPGTSTPTTSFTGYNQQRIGEFSQVAYGTVTGTTSAYAAYGVQQLGDFVQIASGDAVIPPGWHEEAATGVSGVAASQYLGMQNGSGGAGAVALSGDGVYCAVGCALDNHAATAAGRAYVMARSGTSWSEQQVLTASDAAASDWFGNAVALDADGDTLAVGAPQDTNSVGSYTGSVYVFTRSGSSWSQQQRLQAASGGSYESFGSSVALSDDGNTLAIGAVGDNGTAASSGSVHIFTRSGSSWTAQQELKASDAAANDHAGFSVSLSSDGNTLAIGAPDDDNANGTDAGAVYVWTRSAGVWTQQQKIISTTAGVGFGTTASLSSSGDTLIAASPDSGNGSAYIWTRTGGTWSHHTRIYPALGSGASFGKTAAMGGDGAVCVISAYSWDLPASNCGRLDVYRLSAGTWSFSTTLQASDAAASDSFGWFPAISSDGLRIATTAPYKTVSGNANAGKLYVYGYT